MTRNTDESNSHKDLASGDKADIESNAVSQNQNDEKSISSTGNNSVSGSQRFLTFMKLYQNPLITLILFLLLSYRAEIKNSTYYANSSKNTVAGHYKIDDERVVVQHTHWGSQGESHVGAVFVRDAVHLEIPEVLRHSLATVNQPLAERDIPLFLHIPRSGGSHIKGIMRICHNLVEASNMGVMFGFADKPSVKIYDVEDSGSYVNVGTYFREDTELAAELGLVQSDLAGFIAIKDPYIASTLFQAEDINKRGRMFTMVRHPLDRVLSAFHYYAIANYEPEYDPELVHMSFEMYSKQNRTQHNYMVRTLSNATITEELTENHLNLAKEILRKKCLIGLMSEKEHSMMRFKAYFGLTSTDDRTRACEERMHWDWTGKNIEKNKNELPDEGTPAWNILYEKNKFDMELYEYAKQLFRQQSGLFHYHKDGYILGLSNQD